MKSVFLMLALAVGLGGPGVCTATAQAADRLVLDGEAVALQTNPLSPLIESKAITIPQADEQWSSNWRGYVAHWLIRDDALYLTRVEVLLHPRGSRPDADAVATDVLGSVYPGRSEVMADWYSGALVVPRGKVKRYVHMGYGSLFERYTILSIKNGQVAQRLDLSADEFEQLKKRRFAAFQKTPEYATLVNESGSELPADQVADFLFEFAVEQYMAAEAPTTD